MGADQINIIYDLGKALNRMWECLPIHLSPFLLIALSFPYLIALACINASVWFSSNCPLTASIKPRNSGNSPSASAIARTSKYLT